MRQPIPKSSAYSVGGPGTMSRSDSLMAARSAATLIALESTSRATSACTSGRGKRAANPLARPLPVRQPMQALIVWIAAMNGMVSSIVQVSA